MMQYELNHPFAGLGQLRLTASERSALTEACPYFPPSYLDYLSSIALDPENQVKMTFEPKEGDDMGLVECLIEGVWRECILYEVPIMSIRKFAMPGNFVRLSCLFS